MNPILEGWKCPSCFLVHAPFVKSCSCMVNRVHDPSSPMTLNESLAKKQVEEAWQRLDRAIAAKAV